MITPPIEIVDILRNGNFSFANLFTINLGDAYGLGADYILHYTDHAFDIDIGGNTFTPNNAITKASGISRKASTGSDSVEIEFSVTDANLIAAINSRRYINKPTKIERAIIVDGQVFMNYLLPIRTAWGINHTIEGDLNDRSITLVIDSSLGNLTGNNGWYALDSSHKKRHPSDNIMRNVGTVMTEKQQEKYVTNFSGFINSEIKPPALPVIYGYKNVNAVPIAHLKHRKSHTSYRHYFSTTIYCISIGDCDHVDLDNMLVGGDRIDFTKVSNTQTDVGGWSARVRDPSDNNTTILGDTGLNFFLEGMDAGERNRLASCRGKGLTLLFLKNRNRDDWIDKAPKVTLPVRGIKVFDDRTGQTIYSRNPMLQYADYLRSVDYGAGSRGISVSSTDSATIADHFDNLPDSVGNPGINDIFTDLQIDTGNSISDNLNIWIDGVRLYTADYYGEYSLRVETKEAVSWDILEDDLFNGTFPDYESGEFTDRLNQLTYTIKQLVKDNTPGASVTDLIEVGVEATFPEDGSAIHTEWLAEDGGIHNFDSNELTHVNNLEQGFYWAMVDSRISREPREMTLSVGAMGWLSEVGDVYSFTSEVIDHNKTLWRVVEVTEDGQAIELTLKAYSDTFYTPDPDVIPEPVALAQTPTKAPLLAVTGLEVIAIDGAYFLNWNSIVDARAEWYAVEVIRDSVVVQTNQRLTSPPLLLEDLQVGSYEASVTIIGTKDSKDEGIESLFNFTIALPEQPTLTIKPRSLTCEVIPSVTKRFLNSVFELKIAIVNDINVDPDVRQSGSFTLGDLDAGTLYYIWVRTVNLIGESDWTTATFTTGQGEEYFDILDERLLAAKDLLDNLPSFMTQQFDSIRNIFGDVVITDKAIKVEEALVQEGINRTLELDQAVDDMTIFTNGKFPITETQISDNSISAPKILSNAIITRHVLALQIVSDHLVSDSIVSRHVSSEAIEADHIKALAIIAGKLAADSVVSVNIAASQISSYHILANSIVAASIDVLDLFAQNITASGTITGAGLVGGTIDGTEITGVTISADATSASSWFAIKGTASTVSGNSAGVYGSYTGTGLGKGISGHGGFGSGYGGTFFGGGFGISSSCGTGGTAIEATGGSYGLTVSANLVGVDVDSNGTGVKVIASTDGINITSSNVGVRSSGTSAAFYAQSGGYLPFTGAHEGLMLKSALVPKVGDIVSNINTIHVADVSNSFSRMGVSLQKEDRTARGVLVSVSELDHNQMPAGLDKPYMKRFSKKYHLVTFNALGEGAMNVCGENGDIKNGDLICTSSMPGKGMKQSDQEFVRTFTFARALQDVIFNGETDVKYLIAVDYMR